MKHRSRCMLVGLMSLVVLSIVSGVSTVDAQQHGEKRHHRDTGLHFHHPVFTESPFPDTKIRLDYLFVNKTGEGGEEHTPSITGEYRWTRSISTEVKLPYTIARPDAGENESNLNNTKVAVKYANFQFREHGLLLGGGLEVGVPTGDDEKGIGSDSTVEIESFLDAGYKPSENWEVIGRLAVGHTTNVEEEGEADHEVAWSVSALYHATPTVKPNLELFGERVSGGEEDGLSTANVAAGLKLVPFDNRPLNLGLSGAVPVTDDQEVDARVLFSAFYHF